MGIMNKESSDNERIRRVEDKYGEASKGGFQALPDILLKSQGRLGISSPEMVVLINILSYWWYSKELPFPTAGTIAKRMGASPRTTERAISSLASKKLLERIKRKKGGNYLDPSLLVEKLNSLVQFDADYLARNNTAV